MTRSAPPPPVTRQPRTAASDVPRRWFFIHSNSVSSLPYGVMAAPPAGRRSGASGASASVTASRESPSRHAPATCSTPMAAMSAYAASTTWKSHASTGTRDSPAASGDSASWPTCASMGVPDTLATLPSAPAGACTNRMVPAINTRLLTANAAKVAGEEGKEEYTGPV